jgi:thiamine pyrophosphate-dependent acetolactate synthase large subunit-like protein
MKGAELFVRCLENEGVETIFGIPGEENIDVMDVLLESPIQFVTTRHEQGAAFMADVHGRLTGRAGVCLATLGPGACNLVTGVADANMDRAPVVALARPKRVPRALRIAYFGRATTSTPPVRVMPSASPSERQPRRVLRSRLRV